MAETDLETVVATLEAERPDVCVVDSVQTLYADGMTGAPGSVGQVREVAGRLMRVAKERQVAVILVGHVTKEGALAGPRVLEHLVDCVLQFEGERERTYRTLRALKNRFGSTNEVGVFEMRERGLVEVERRLPRFVEEATRAPGSVVLCAMEGSRPLLVEVQALVAPTELVPPRRVANGVDRNRLALVLAVLARHAGLGLGSSDVFVSVAGGVRVDEPGADLAIALALASAARGVSLGAGGKPLAAFGEIGLTGELRYVAHADRRLAEAAKFGLEPVSFARRQRSHPASGAPRRLWKATASWPMPLRAGQNPLQSQKTPQMQGTCPRMDGCSRTPGTRSPSWKPVKSPGWCRALEMVAPGTAVREGIDAIGQGASERSSASVTARSSRSSTRAESGSTSTTRRRCSTRWRRWTGRSSSTRTPPRSAGPTSS